MKKKSKVPDRVKQPIPIEAVLILHRKGGAQTTQKGGKGYDRTKEKKKMKNEMKNNITAFSKKPFLFL